MTDYAEDPPYTATGKTRRDFVYVATGAMGAGAAVLATWPIIDQMNPSADVIAQGMPVNSDVSKIRPGEQTIVVWRSRPVFILHRTPAQLNMLQQTRDTRLLNDPNSKTKQQPDYAQNWHRSLKPEFLVAIGICTHLGCIPNLKPAPGSIGPNWPGGYLCPCHGSRYDLSARVFKDVPAPYNLPVPPYHFPDDNTVRIGENPKGSMFDFSSIVQI